MRGTKAEVISLSEYAYDRTLRRLQSLSDREYLWEPVPGCWSVRADDEGTFRADGGNPQVPPFTTIAWRLWHLVGCYGARRNAQWLGAGHPTPGFERDDPVPPEAAGALAALTRANRCWRDLLAALSDEAWDEPLGPIAGPYAEQCKAGLVLHQLDEQIHHGAELGVLRDLYRAWPRP